MHLLLLDMHGIFGLAKWSAYHSVLTHMDTHIMFRCAGPANLFYPEVSDLYKFGGVGFLMDHWAWLNTSLWDP